MSPDDAITRFAALATPSRLRVMNFLMERGPEGMASGEIARQLNVAQNTLSTQLLLLSNARLVSHTRRGRSIVYSVNDDAVAELAKFVNDGFPDPSVSGNRSAKSKTKQAAKRASA